MELVTRSGELDGVLSVEDRVEFLELSIVSLTLRGARNRRMLLTVRFLVSGKTK